MNTLTNHGAAIALPHSPLPESDSLSEVRALVSLITANVMGVPVTFRVARDVKQPDGGRVFIQCIYQAACSLTGKPSTWRGRKWYLSDHMTNDEVVKTCFAAFKGTVEHEVMEGFHFGGKRVFNPHTPFTALMEAGRFEQYRMPLPGSLKVACAACDRGDFQLGHHDGCPNR